MFVGWSGHFNFLGRAKLRWLALQLVIIVEDHGRGVRRRHKCS